MTRFFALALACGLIATADTRTRADEPYTPAPAEKVPGYFARPMPCKIARDLRTEVKCDGALLESKSLRELSILRNTIYARYGWDGYRKPWLRAYFHAQPWFKPNPRFSYKQLAEADRKNAHFIAVREQSLTDVELGKMRDDIFARYGKVWTEKPEWTLKNGKSVKQCARPRGAAPSDFDDIDASFPACRYAKAKWYKPDPNFSPSKIADDDKIELGLLSRAMGQFALDDESRGKTEGSLDRTLGLEEVRQLSLRDLRLLRNTIYARRGRTFKSEVLRDHFSGMEWYKPRPDYSDKLLTQNDVRNVALIKSVENEFGGPLSDEDWLTEPATDGA
ncbi:MAG TPA: YARHG domain-containing protein [Polyangia bacterium]